MLPFCHRRPVIAAAIVAALSLSSASAEDCREMIDQFNVVADGGRTDDAQALVDRIATSADCGRYQVAAQRQVVDMRHMPKPGGGDEKDKGSQRVCQPAKEPS